MSRAPYLWSTAVLITLLVSVPSCSHRVEQPPATPPFEPNEQSVGALLWFQSAAEAKALYYQAYQLARMRLTEQLLQKHPSPPAVVVDIDETLLDNSPHQAKLILTHQTFPAFWDEWIDRAEALPLPGAVEFLRFADSCGVAVFYVSNRDAKTLEPTMTNLARHGFPQLLPERFLLRSTESSKADRRRHIEDRYTIVLLVGDNLNDFSELFERQSVSDRSATVDQLRNEFGKSYIIIPNPYYGDWENAVFGYRRGLSVDEKNRLRIEALRSF